MKFPNASLSGGEIVNSQKAGGGVAVTFRFVVR